MNTLATLLLTAVALAGLPAQGLAVVLPPESIFSVGPSLA